MSRPAIGKLLTEDEINYLNTLLEDKVVTVQPYDPRIKNISDQMVEMIKDAVPDLEVRFLGASSLAISGQNDIDIYVFCDRVEFDQYLPKMKQILGDVSSKGETSIAWKREEEGFEVEIYLTDPTSNSMKRQLAVMDLLQGSPELIKEYEALKQNASGKSIKEYQRRKYEFYNRILANNQKI